jgi:dCMP deaminase
MNWDETFIKMADLISKKSKDESTKVGCVIVSPDNVVLSTGFNGFARGIQEEGVPQRWERPAKYTWIVHAEANAVFNAARHGIKLMGAKAYLNYAPCPCERCADALIQAGITEVIGPSRLFPGKGVGVHYDLDLAGQKFAEAGVVSRTVCVDL